MTVAPEPPNAPPPPPPPPTAVTQMCVTPAGTVNVSAPTAVYAHVMRVAVEVHEPAASAGIGSASAHANATAAMMALRSDPDTWCGRFGCIAAKRTVAERAGM